MTTTKQKKRERPASSRINVPSLDAGSTCRCMNCLLVKISTEDIARSWTGLRANVKGATHRTSSARRANGTTFNLGILDAVTAWTMPDGFVLRFTVKDTCTSNGAKSE